MKQVHWQLPFESLDGNRYRIDIYSDADENENENWPIQLKGAGIDEGGPLTTDGDKSDDFFAPMRPQTGNIHIVNTSGELSIFDILPKDNTDRPVRVINETNGALEWQGYLKCENYSQGYNARPQQIDITIISVLEAMKDVSLPTAMVITPTMTLRQLIEGMLGEMNRLSQIHGVSRYIDRYIVPHSYNGVLDYSINPAVLVKENQFENALRIEYTSDTDKIADVIGYIATLFGWVAVEYYGSILFLCAGERTYDEYQADNHQISTTMTLTDRQMQDLHYHGIGHSITVSAPADVVTVKANMKKVEMGIDIPAFPRGLSGSYGRHFVLERGTGQLPVGEVMDEEHVQMVISNQDNAYGNVEFGYRFAIMKFLFEDQKLCEASVYGNTTQETALRGDIMNNSSSEPSQFDAKYQRYLTDKTEMTGIQYAGAYYARITHNKFYEDGESKEPEHEFDGILCSFFPGSKTTGSTPIGFDASRTDYILRISSKSISAYTNGNIDIHLKGTPIWLKSIKMGIAVNQLMSYGLICYHDDEDKEGKYDELVKNKRYMFQAELQFGEQYWNGNSWQTTRTRFDVLMDSKGAIQEYQNRSLEQKPSVRDFIRIPIGSNMGGSIVFSIYPVITPIYTQRFTPYFNPYVVDVMFSEIKVDVSSLSNPIENLRGGFNAEDVNTNVYSRRLSRSNRESEVVIDTNIGTTLYNKNTDNALRDSNGRLVRTVSIGGAIVKPEQHLLGRMAAYYAKPMSAISLEVDRADAKVAHYAGYDGKTYLQLSESRDWGRGLSTIQCFECPE